jgi:hypothetical protein
MAERHVLAALSVGGKEAGYAAARLIAQGWEGGSDHNMTALATGAEWSSYRLIEEIDQLTGRNLPQSTPAEKRAADKELKALRAWAMKAPEPYVFWSTYGHRFMDENGEGSCMSCGARFELFHDSKTDIDHGRYRNGAGDDPFDCPRHSVTHGEAECSNEQHDPEEAYLLLDGKPCPNCTSECNCDACR